MDLLLRLTNHKMRLRKKYLTAQDIKDLSEREEMKNIPLDKLRNVWRKSDKVCNPLRKQFKV